MGSLKLLAASVLVQAALALVGVQASVTCKDENDNDVDWFIMYKAPETFTENDAVKSTSGGQFAYIDPSTSKDYWQISSQSLLTDRNPLAYSVAPLFEDSQRAKRDVTVHAQRRQRRFVFPLFAGIASKAVVGAIGGLGAAVGAVGAGMLGNGLGTLRRRPGFLEPVLGNVRGLLPTWNKPAILITSGAFPKNTDEDEKKKKKKRRKNKEKKHKDPLMYALYNDQPPRGNPAPEKAHSKGIVISDEDTGVWIQHTVPEFLDTSLDAYTFPERARKFGQAIMCITFNTATELDKIAYHLRLQQANVYNKSAPSELSQRYSNMHQLLQGTDIAGSTEAKEDLMTSAGGATFHSVSKPKLYAADLYSSFIAQRVAKDSLLVQSWLSSPGTKIEPYCNGTITVLNSEHTSLNMSATLSWKWKHTKDHGKVAVAMNTPWFCFGSLNRKDTQKSRGGEVTCMQNSRVHRLFRNAYSTTEHC